MKDVNLVAVRRIELRRNTLMRSVGHLGSRRLRDQELNLGAAGYEPEPGSPPTPHKPPVMESNHRKPTFGASVPDSAGREKEFSDRSVIDR